MKQTKVRLGKNEKAVLKYALKYSQIPNKIRGFGLTTGDLRRHKVLDNVSSVPMESLARKGYLEKLKYYGNWNITEKGKKKLKEL